MDLIPTLIIGAGQAGLATAREISQSGVQPVVLEASDRTAGSWPQYYDSLTLFSPARYSGLPGMPFPGDPHRYPHRDEVASYLESYAAALDADIRTNHQVARVEAEDDVFRVTLTDGQSLRARQVVSTTGSFRRPYTPPLEGLATFGGEVLHAADYRNPAQLAGKRVTVVGGGNSAVQIAVELAHEAEVTLATRADVRFAPQFILGRDFHEWASRTGIARLQVPRWLSSSSPSNRVLDVGVFRAALRDQRPERRQMFARIGRDHIEWADGEVEPCDAIVFATGYRPAVEHLAPLGALDPHGRPLHSGGISTVIPGLAYVGISGQRSVSSAALLGVGRDARYIAKRLRQSREQGIARSARRTRQFQINTQNTGGLA